MITSDLPPQNLVACCVIHLSLTTRAAKMFSWGYLWIAFVLLKLEILVMYIHYKLFFMGGDLPCTVRISGTLGFIYIGAKAKAT